MRVSTFDAKRFSSDNMVMKKDEATQGKYYAPIFYDLILHGTTARKLRPLMPEIMHSAEHGVPVRVFGQHIKMFITGEDPALKEIGTEMPQTGLGGKGGPYYYLAFQSGGEPMPPVENGKIGFELTFAGNREIAAAYQAALNKKIPFKFYVPKDGIRVHCDQNLVERINAHNRKVGKQELKALECRARLYTFEILDGRTGAGIIRVVLL